jgi:ABC-type nitrate/sulfonate/bicarbonate transport system substrate-binding protein
MNDASERRLVLKGVLSVWATTGGLLGSLPALAQDKDKLSTLRSTSRSWLWSAEDYAFHQKLFDKAGLAVELAATNRGVNQDALLSGAAEVLLGSPATNMRVQLQGRPVKMICGWVNKFASNVVIKKSIADKAGVTEASPPDAKAAALRGLRIGTTGPGGGPDQLTRYLMQRGKIDPDRDAQLVPIQGGPSAMVAAFDKGQIDGFCLSSPSSDVAVSRFGGAYLFNMVTNPPPEMNDFLYIVRHRPGAALHAPGPCRLQGLCQGLLQGPRSQPVRHGVRQQRGHVHEDPSTHAKALRHQRGVSEPRIARSPPERSAQQLSLRQRLRPALS